MKDVFAHVLQRSRGVDLPSPVLPSRFEQAGSAGSPDDFATIEEIVSTRPDRRQAIAPPDRSAIVREPARDAGTTHASVEPSLPTGLHEFVLAPQARQSETSGPRATREPAAAPPAALDLQAIIAAALRRRDGAGAAITVPDRADQDRPTNDGDDVVRPHAEVRAVPATVAPSTAAPATVEIERPAAPRSVEVRIGRIEITAAAPPAPRPAPMPRASRPSAAALSLRDYLASRHRR